MPAAQEMTPGVEIHSVPEENQVDGFRIRSYKPQDRKTVCELFVDGMMEYCPPNANQILREYVNESLEMDLADIQQAYLNAGGHFWAAVANERDQDEEVVGMVGIDPRGEGGDRAEVRRLSVRKSYRRHGVARQLVAHLESWAREQGFKAIYLNCGAEMPQALRFYDALGFVRTHEEVLCEDPYQYLVHFEKMLVV